MTTPIDLAFALVYLKADPGPEDDLITGLIESARIMCQDYCNRVFYDTQDQADADFTVALADRANAFTTRTTLLAANEHDARTQDLINDRYIQTLGNITKRINGIVLDDAIKAAQLLTLGHLYINREDNVSTGNNVVALSVGAQRILQSKLWIGNLVSDDICGS